MEIKHKLIVGTRVMLSELLSIGQAAPRAQLLVTFLSILELGRMGYVSLFQNEVYGDIHIDTKKPIERNVLERVQEFETQNAEAVASSIINEAIEEKIDLEEAFENAQPTETSGAQLSFDGSLAPEQVAQESEDMATDEEILAAESELSLDSETSGAKWSLMKPLLLKFSQN